MFAKLASCCWITTNAFVRVDSVHAHGAILTLMVDTIVDVYLAKGTSKAGWTHASVVGIVRIVGGPARAAIVARTIELRVVHLGRHTARIFMDNLSDAVRLA